VKNCGDRQKGEREEQKGKGGEGRKGEKEKMEGRE